MGTHPSEPREAALAGIEVVDVCGSISSAYCGKLLADFGAEVTNLEAEPKGHPARQLGSFRSGDASGMYAYLSANKKSVSYSGVLEQSDSAKALLERADVVLTDPAGSCLERTGLEWIAEVAPSAVAVSLSWFGRSGPYADYRGSEGVIASLVGLVRGIGPAEGPPLLPAGYQCQMITGTTAFVATLGQLLGRRMVGVNRFTQVEASVLEATMCLTEPGPISSLFTDETRPRLGINRFWPTFPAAIYPCRQGHLGVTALTPSQWKAFCELLGLEQLGTDPRYQITLQRLEDADQLEAQIKPKLLDRTAEEWFLLGQENRIPLAVVPTIEQILSMPQFTERGAFCTIEDEHGAFEMPAVPFRLDRTPARSGGRPPQIGEHNGRTPRFPVGQGADHGKVALHENFDPRLPLSGIRIVDLGMGWAGPLATRQLADMGAEIVKVESCQYFDWWRGWEVTSEMLEERLYEKAPPFLTVNRNKKAITLDLTREEGRALLGRLVERSDALVENYAGSVLPRLGLGEEQLRLWNPELVYLTMPPFGASGAWRDFRAYGSTVEHASGLPHLQGKEDWPPTMQHVALGDPVAGMTGAAALLVALFHKMATGEGQTVDLSHVESLFALGAHGFVEYALGGAAPRRLGSRHPIHAPRGAFPCRPAPCREGEATTDSWIVITVESDEQWAALSRYLARQNDVSADAKRQLSGRFASRERRKEHEDELEELIATVSRTRDRDELARELQAEGVPAAPVLGTLDVLNDEHLCARGYWQWHERAHVGSIPNPSAPFRFSSSSEPPQAPLEIRTPSPTLGEHNWEVLADLLGLGADEITALENENIIGTEPVRA